MPPSQNTPPPHSGYAPSYPPPLSPPPSGYVDVTVFLQTRDAINCLLFTGFQIPEVSRASTLPRTPIVHSRSQVSQVPATHLHQGHPLATIIHPVAHRPINTSNPLLHLANINHLQVLLVNINRPQATTNFNHLRALLPNQGTRDRNPPFKTAVVIQVRIHTNRHPGLPLRVHPRFQEIAPVTLRTRRTVSFPNVVRLSDA